MQCMKKFLTIIKTSKKCFRLTWWTNVFLWIWQRFPNCGALLSSGAHELFVWGTCLFKTKYWLKIKYIFGRHFAWFKYFTYCLVPVLTPNYKQHILLPAKVRKVCHSLAELYVKSVYLNLFGWRGAQGIEVWEPLEYNKIIFKIMWERT
jgi:hypothetical protein